MTNITRQRWNHVGNVQQMMYVLIAVNTVGVVLIDFVKIVLKHVHHVDTTYVPYVWLIGNYVRIVKCN